MCIRRSFWLISLFFLLPNISQASLFSGQYSTDQWYDANIQDGPNSLSRQSIEISINEASTTDRFNVNYTDAMNSFSTPLPEFHLQSYDVIGLPEGNFVYDSDTIIVDMLIVSDGSHMAMAIVDQNTHDPNDIGFRTASWLRNDAIDSETIDLSGSWYITSVDDPNLRDLDNGFDYNTPGTVYIEQISLDTILVPRGSGALSLNIDGNRASLTDGPVATDDGIVYIFDVIFDETGFSFISVVTESDDPGDVSILMGYGSPVPIPTTVFLFATGLLGLAGLSRRKS